MKTLLHFSLLFTTITLLLHSPPSAVAANPPPNASQDFVRTSCLGAEYPTLCLRTLSSYAGTAKTPAELARAAVNVSLSRARKTSGFLSKIRSRGHREQEVLNQCLDQIAESIDELSNTLSELRGLDGGGGFRWRMNNAETWVSAALTDDDTCLDGFKEATGGVRADVRRKIKNVARVTSNALYLIDRLDQSRRS